MVLFIFRLSSAHLPLKCRKEKKCQFLRIHKKRAKLQFFFDIYKFICTFAENLLKMLLGLIFSILTATYTIESSTAVTLDGIAPAGSQATYSRSGTTGQKGQMTEGNSTTLQLTGWEGCVIDSVVLSMHSNTSQGAGGLTMHIGNALVWEIQETDFANVAWNGSFTTNWVEISSPIGSLVQAGEPIEIYIEASKNSLYIQSYTFYYTAPEPEAHEVAFISGIGVDYPSMIEESIGAGVLLPQGVDTLDWRFLGWSETEVLETDTCPPIWQAGERYFPKHDCRMWAVYSDMEGGLQQKQYLSGDYVIASGFWQASMCGAVADGMVATRTVELLKENQDYIMLSNARDDMLYSIVFLADSMLTIQHLKTEKYIGYSGTKLSNQDSKWRYRVLPDSSLCVYYEPSGKCRMLTFGFGANATSDNVVAYSTSINLSLMQSDGLLLFPAHMAVFTTWPFGRLDSVENIFDNNSENRVGECVMHFGNYTLHIRNGRKYLHICQ